MNEFDGHLSENDELLVDKGVDVGVAIDTHEQMSLVEITPNLLSELLGDHTEAVSVRSGIVFWFSAAGTWATVNRMATLNLLAGGQGVFGIAVGAALPSLREDIRQFPSETATGERQPGVVDDELAKRRNQVA